MKQNVSKTGSNRRFRKNVKTCLQNKKVYLIPAFKAWPFSSDFNFASKDDRVTAVTCKHCPLVVSPIVTNCCKSSILNMAKFLDPSLKTSPCTKTSPVSCKNQSFFIILKYCHLNRKSLCFSVLLFTVRWSIFDQPFRRLPPLSCFYRSSQWLFKVKITCKRVNFIKK